MFQVSKILRTTQPDFMSAMDLLKAKVMIADSDLNIVYMNESVRSLLQEAESDLQKDLPSFRVKDLVGKNIDVFHKNPKHQRGMLAGMTKPHTATITIGTRMFDLFVTPLMNGAACAGFVVEWSNANERLLNHEYAAQANAIGRNLAIIEFTPDGHILEANENFQRAMGYSLEEIRGRHHAMFVTPSYRASAEYKEFWNKLRRGEHHTGQFERLKKSGETIWIEGSYNPVLDRNGKPRKIIKLVSDVTAQVKLLRDLKVLIDGNFGEIADSLSVSAENCERATTAAIKTLEDAGEVKASATGLVASIAEIADAINRSHVVTNNAVASAADVGEKASRMINASQSMNGIIELIRSIAGQINLLALNATIEAARAGEAGRGFAVVAGEVKNLAKQSASATEQIRGEIAAIQETANDVAAAVEAIKGSISSISEFTTKTAAAIEEQSASTQSISVSMGSTTAAIDTVSASISEITQAVQQVRRSVDATKAAAEVLVR